MSIQWKHLSTLIFIAFIIFSCTESFTATATDLLNAAAKGELDKVIKIIKSQQAPVSKKSAIAKVEKISIDCRNDDGRTPLMQAAYWGRVSVVKILVENKADINAVDADGSSSLAWAISGKKNDVCKYLIEKKADVNIKDKHGQTALLRSIQCDNAEIITLLLDAGADVNIQDNEGRTPLIMAVQENENGIVELLIKKGADISKKDKKNKSAADYTGNSAKLKTLLAANNAEKK